MKRQYTVRVKLPVTITVEIDAGDSPHWRDECAVACKAAIEQVIARCTNASIIEGIQVLKDNALMYPLDFAEVEDGLS